MLLRVRGAFLSALGAALIASFATYRAADPSLNVASPDAPHNAMGWPGAVLADLSLQSIGLAAWIGALLMVAAGFRQAGAPDPRAIYPDQRRRALIAAAGVLIAAAALAAPRPPVSWPLARGLGGFWGDAVLSLLAHPLKMVGGAGAPTPSPRSYWR